jgi:hypothetical protein
VTLKGSREGAVAKMRDVIVYGIASSLSGDVEDFYATRDEAEATLGQILADEPEFEGATLGAGRRVRGVPQLTPSRPWRHAVPTAARIGGGCVCRRKMPGS